MARGFFDTPSVPALWGSIAPFLVLDIIAVALRFFTRRKLRQSWAFDDWLMIPSLIGVIALCTIYFYGLGVKSLGYRWTLLPPPDADLATWVPEFAEPSTDRIVLTRRIEYSSLVIFAAVNGCIKLSVLAFYQRIFVVAPHWKNARTIFFTIMMVLIGMWATAYLFTFMFMCGTSFQVLFIAPEEMFKKCIDTLTFAYSYSISDFITDGLIILIPIPFIWQLQLPVGRKLAVVGVFLLGIIASGASLVRLAWMTYNQKVGFGAGSDEELMITTELYWMNLEMTLGLLASCLPTLRGLMRTTSVDSVIKGVRGMFSVRSGSSNGSSKNSMEYDRGIHGKSRQFTVTVNSDFSRTSHGDNRV